MKKESKANTEESRFDISDEVLDQLLKDYRKPEDLLGSDGIIRQLTKRAIERIMNAEMDSTWMTGTIQIPVMTPATVETVRDTKLSKATSEKLRYRRPETGRARSSLI